ncbi:MAG: cold shock domain-containing protein [Kofleriaceae bacterium]
MKMLTGVVRFFDAQRGIGFVVPDDGSAEVFLHASEIHVAEARHKHLADGQRVFFATTRGEGQRRAVHVIPGGYSFAAARRAI